MRAIRLPDREAEFRKRWGLTADNPGPVLLPKMLWEEDHARRLEAERDAGKGGIVLFGSADSQGSSNGETLPPSRETGGHRYDGAAAQAGDADRLPYDLGSLDRADAKPRIEPNVDGFMDDRASGNVTYRRIWPVPGEGRAARQFEVGPNGRTYSDGRYSPSGAYRGGNPHYGIDLPAPTGASVVAADDGVVLAPGYDKGWGNYVPVEHRDGTIGLYAHLGPGKPPAARTRIRQGEKIGVVGTSGNAGTKGDHLHYEVRQNLGEKTLKRPSTPGGGGVPINPTAWMQRRVSRYRPD